MKTLPTCSAVALAGALLLTGPIACSDSARAGKSLVVPERVDAALARLIETDSLVGVSALVYEDGQEAYFGAHGFANREDQTPMKRDTLAYIYSMTKPITGVALMQLHERGLFQLDDPLEKHAPEFSGMKVFAGYDSNGEPIFEELDRPITIRDVTRHTAGFAYEGASDFHDEKWEETDPMHRDNTLPEMARKLASIPLVFQPGTQWAYGPSVDVQALLVERLSGQPFDQYLQKNIFDPLGMEATRYYYGPEAKSRLAAIYSRSDDGAFTPEPSSRYEYNASMPTLKRGGSGLISTLDDYMRFARMLLNEGELEGNRILQPETVKLMATDAIPEEVTEKMWLPTKGQVGFGIDFAVRLAPPIDAEEASGEVGEFFWDGFASTLFWVDPENAIAAVLFTQYIPFGSVPVHKTFRDAVYHDDETASALARAEARE